MGVCALQIKNYPLAQQAFARVTQLYPEDGEAWSNLASSFMKQDKLYIMLLLPLPLHILIRNFAILQQGSIHSL